MSRHFDYQKHTYYDVLYVVATSKGVNRVLKSQPRKLGKNERIVRLKVVIDHSLFPETILRPDGSIVQVT